MDGSFMGDEIEQFDDPALKAALRDEPSAAQKAD